jgi:DNA modification methylase
VITVKRSPSKITKQTRAQPADQVETRTLAAIVPYPQNARTHSDEQIELLANLMLRYGVDQPIVVDEAGVILKGHGRRLAAIKAGFETFPVVVQRGLSDDAKRALRIADNQVALLAGWDLQLMQLELGELKLHGFDLPLLGFGDAELASFIDANPGLTDPDEVPAEPVVPVTRPGDVWLLGRHRLLCGDATSAADVALALGGSVPLLMVTDPPYGVDYDPKWRAEAGVNNNRAKMGDVANDDRADWRTAWVLFRGDVAYCWHAGKHASTVQASLEAAGFEMRSQIIWAKDRFALSRGDYHWQHEPCWYAVRKGARGRWHGDRSQTTLWQIPAREDSGHGHGTQKPVECMRRPIENNSAAGDAVYDPFVGSGTTIIAAEMTGRACRALEINPAYVDVAVLRWQAFTGEQATLQGLVPGQAFEQVKAERLGNSEHQLEEAALLA